MKEFLKSVAFKAIAAVALFLVGIMIYAASTGGVSTIPAAVTGAIITPLQSLATAVSDGFNSFIGIFTDSNALRAENEQLQNEINELRKNEVETDELRRQNELYREFLELKDQHADYQFADARIISTDPADKYGNFTINAGSLKGVKADDPVITPDGLVGVVYEVGPNYAKVATILDPSVSVEISEMVKATGAAFMDAPERRRTRRLRFSGAGGQAADEPDRPGQRRSDRRLRRHLRKRRHLPRTAADRFDRGNSAGIRRADHVRRSQALCRSEKPVLCLCNHRL